MAELISDEAVEAASRAIFISTGQYGVQWDDLDTYVKNRFRQDGQAALSAAAPFIAAQATSIIADLIDNEPCSFDHNHSCQAHGYFYLKQEEACPQHDAKEWVKTYGASA